MYRLNYYSSLALVNKEDKASKAYVGGACVDRIIAKGRIKAVTAGSNY